MIIIRDEENINVVELFDTVKEFKQYIDNYLTEMEKGMNEDGLLQDRGGNLLEIPLNKAGFSYKLSSYKDITGDQIQFI